MDLVLSNREAQQQLSVLMNDIQIGLLDHCDAILEEIVPIFDQLNTEDQQQFVKHIHEKFPDQAFIKNEKFQPMKLQQDDQQKHYYQLRKTRDWKMLAKAMKDERFCSENQFPLFWSQTETVNFFLEFDFVLQLLLEFHDLNNPNNGSNYLKIIKYYFLFQDLTLEIHNQGKNQIEQVIGSMLSRQLQQFIEYKKHLKQNNIHIYQRCIKQIQDLQLQVIDKQNLDFQSSGYQVLIQILTFNYHQKNLEQYLKQKFQIQDEILNYKELSEKVNYLLFQIVNLEEIYFIISFYYLTSYSDQFGFLKDKRKLDNDLSIIKGDQQRQRKQVERFLKAHNQIKDEIYEFIVQQLIIIEENENKIMEENLKKYQVEIDQYEFLLQKYKQYNFQTFIQEAEISQAIVNYSQMLPQIKLIQIFKDETIFKKLLLVKMILENNESIKIVKEAVAFNFEKSILECSIFLEKIKTNFQSFESVILILYLIGLIRNFPIKSLQLYGNIFQIEKSFEKGFILTKLQEVIELETEKIECSSLFLQELMKLQKKDWINLKKCLLSSGFNNLFQKFLSLYLIQNSEQHLLCSVFEIIKQIGNTLYFESKDGNRILLKFLLNTTKQLFDLVAIKNFQISEDNFFNCISDLISFLKTFEPKEVSYVLNSLTSINSNLIINFKFVKEQLTVRFSLNLIQISLKINYYQSIKNTQKLFNQCSLLYQEDHLFYQTIFSQFQFFNELKLKPAFLGNFINQSNLPRDSNIGLEDFNLSITEISQVDKENIASQWMADTKNSENFKLLIPLYFNVIKKKESFNKFVNLINIQKKGNSNGFNMKLLFQILFNNSNHELQAMLLKLWSQSNPVPLMYNNPNINSIKTEDEVFCLNNKIFHIFPNCFPMINFSLSNVQQSYGKTQIINEVFYKTQIFEIRDSSRYNQNTIDIMFDFFFNESRKFAIADVHGQIPQHILQKLLSLFKIWIIQMDTEDEIEQNFENLNTILQTCKPDACCFIVRNANFINKIEYDNIEMKLKNKNIFLHKIIDLTQKGLDQFTYEMEIQKFSKFIYNLIEKPYLEAINMLQNLSSQDDFFRLTENFYGSKSQLVLEAKQDNEIIKNIENELSKLVLDTFGFYSQNAFPMRYLFWRISNIKEEQLQFEGLIYEKQQNLVIEKQLEIEALEKKIQYVGPSKIIQLFQKIFDSKNYYILYIQMAERIRKFKDKHTFELQEHIENLNEKLSKLQQDKKEQLYKSRFETLTESSQYEQQLKFNEKNEEEIKKLNEKLNVKLKLMNYRNIGIELFWRELVQIKKRGAAKKLFINPIKILAQLVLKGEPFEFLDGDQLEINHKFLQEFFKEFTDPDKYKVLVMSVIGPQSSGKSTILNKMFGCHFWTSVGRCTKGIYLQLIKIHQKQMFNNLFDYILILDTEGLQNPNQQDPKFDKKISLFVLAISDILVLNVKGNLNQQFRELVKMCVYTLSQMSSAISTIKLLSWCFNQNSDCQNHQPFLEQIQEISHSVNLQISEKSKDEIDQIIDCNQVLDIKKSNIKVLGFASSVKVWRENNNYGIFKEWEQLMPSETFSEETYLFGLRTMQQLTKKFSQQPEQQHLKTLSEFIQIIESNWQSISSLPDLLEFVDLCQFHQDQLMNKYQVQIMQNIQLNCQEFISQLFAQENQEEYDIQSLKVLEQKKRIIIKENILNINQELEENLKKFQKEKQLSKKIYEKYLGISQQRLNCFEMQCLLELVKYVKDKEREFQQNKGFKQLEDYMIKIYMDQNEMQNLIENPSQMKANFNPIWQEILESSMSQQEQAFQKYSQAQYKSIHFQFAQYQYKTKNHQEYQKLLQNQFNKIFPHLSQKQECDKIFAPFKKELLEQIQFNVLRNDGSNMKYFDVFSSPIDQRMQKSKTQDIINIDDFYSYQAQIIQIPLEDFQNYIKSDCFFIDYQNYLEKTDKKEMVDDFFIIIDLLGINFDQSSFKLLLEQPNNPKQVFKQFQESLQFNYKKLLINSFFNSRIINSLYQSLKLKETVIEAHNIEQLELELQNQSKYNLTFVLNTQIGNKLNTIYKKQDWFFHHIINPKNSSKIEKELFQQKAVEIFQQIMMQQDIWVKFYFQIYQIIYTEMVQINYQLQQNEKTTVVISSADDNLIKIILSKIEQKIVEFNYETSKFGLILKDVGERCIFYFSILIIWRFSCYKEWQTLEMNHNKLKEVKDEQFQKCFAEIQKNLELQSQLIAESYAKSIKEIFFNSFYAINAKSARQQILQNNCANSELIGRLDNEILEKNYQEGQYNSSILQYISDQRAFVEQRVEQIIKSILEQIKNQFQITLNNQFKSYLRNILKNVLKLKQNFANLASDFASEEFFKENISKNQSTMVFTLITNCIFGQYDQSIIELRLIKNHFMPIFQLDQYCEIKPLLETKYFTQQDQKIKLVKPFIDTLYQKLQFYLDEDPVDLVLAQLQIQPCLNILRLNMNGCQHCCPMCKRKCDQPYQNQHKHQCQNGHQLRGMNGVLIDNSPSLNTCDEIEDDQQIQILETGALKKWKDVKVAYNEWIFKSFDTTQQQRVKEKMTRIWNNGIGKLVCDDLQIKMKNSNIVFEEKSKFNFIKYQPTHYMFVLDDSGSMRGPKWQKVIKGYTECMQQIKKNPLARVSVITFDDKAQVLFDCIEANDFDSNQKLPFKGFGTNFRSAFSEINNSLIKHSQQNFQKTIILFYTDGEDYFPKQEINKFSELPSEFRQKISFFACTDQKFQQKSRSQSKSTKGYCSKLPYTNPKKPFESDRINELKTTSPQKDYNNNNQYLQSYYSASHQQQQTKVAVSSNKSLSGQLQYQVAKEPINNSPLIAKHTPLIEQNDFSTLMLIEKELCNLGVYTDLKQEIDLENLSQIWIEKISQSHHQFKLIEI